MEMPKEYNDLVAKAIKKFQNDIEAGLKWLILEAEKLPGYSEIQEEVIRRGHRGILQDARHAFNDKLREESLDRRKEGGFYVSRPKVVGASSPAVQKVFNSIYALNVAGRTLGNLTGAELAPEGKKMIDRSKGTKAIGLFLIRIAETRLVASDQRVNQAKKLTESKLQVMYDQCHEAVEKEYGDIA